ncbi:hypothetical protein COV18_00445 [Candidatus Woesearchaeota archaeon CG10_big_fil_rev_8_21_14_0_10_37_12]|nr:MAG: hypothetical protein COV18_00445 [Candidatus Woesearchaeota archaeon CG10_big_fil_rev_8_21_14_0_10_37_12]
MNLPNALSTFRIILAPFAYTAGFTGHATAFITLYVLGCISDILDGYFARKWKQHSKLGSALDTIADVLFYPSALSIFVLVPDIPLLIWYIIFAEIALMILALLVSWKKNKLTMDHRLSGKATATITFICIITFVLYNYVFWLAYLLIIIFAWAIIDKIQVCLK